MARALTTDELNLLRSDGQWSKLYLAVLNPNTIYTARLAALPSSNDNVHTIAYNTGSGTLSDVKAGMTLYVGTTAGAHDLGICRIRKDPIAGTFYIGLISEITWQSTCYLTVVDDFDLWAKHAVIESSALKMDVDVAYSDQHGSFAPVPLLGLHAVAKLESSTVNVQFGPPVGDSSWVFGSTISSVLWSIPDAIAIDNVNAVRPIATFDSVGTHLAYCTVTAANGKTTRGVRKAYIWDDENMPATVFQLAQCVADYETGGWMFDLTTEAEASLSEIRDRSLVVLFAEDWYGFPPNQTKQSIGPIAGRENIVCVGRIVGQSIRWDRESGFVHFTVQGFHHWLNKIKGFPIQLQPATVAASWSQMPLMTVDRVLWHVLYWHSTVIETMDFYPPNDTRYTPDGMTMASSIWGQLADIAFSKILASPGVDRFGRLFVEVDPQMVPLADRDDPVVMDLTEDDWQEGIDLQRVTVEDVSLIRLSTQNVNSSGSSLTLYSLSPGHTPRRYGEPELLDRVLAASQAQSNQIAGLLMGWRTNEFPDVPVVFLQNNRMFDLFPRQYAGLTVDAGDTARGITYDGNLIPRRISLYFDNDIGYMHPEINFDGETFEQLSTNGDVPETDEDDLSLPPVPGLPELPDLDIIIPGITEPSPDGPVKVLAHDQTVGLLYTENFHESAPDWITVNAGLGGLDGGGVERYKRINMIHVCPNGAVYVGYYPSSNPHNAFIARAPSIGGTFTILYDCLDPALNGGDGEFQIWSMAINPLVSEQVGFIMGPHDPRYFYIGANTSFVQGALMDSDFRIGQGADALSYGGGKWLAAGVGEFQTITADGSAIDIGGAAAINGGWHLRASTTGITYHNHVPNGTLKRAENNLGSLVTMNSTDSVRLSTSGGVPLYADCDPTGTLIMTRALAGVRGKSSDSGTTWAALPSLPVGNYVFRYAGNPGTNPTTSRWIAAGAVMRYSPDFGTTWLNREGNLSQVTPLPDIQLIRVVQP